jgi:C4-dicarboxylate transporter, DctQ subunit
MVAMTIGYGANVLVRGALPGLAAHFAWIDELSLFGLVWMVFLALSVGLGAGRHIGMRIALGMLPPDLRIWAKRLINLLGLILSLYLVKIGVEITLFVAHSGQRSPTLGISVAWLYCVIPLGFFLLAVRYLLELVTPADRFTLAIDPAHHL